jgi:hypothetical protein
MPSCPATSYTAIWTAVLAPDWPDRSSGLVQDRPISFHAVTLALTQGAGQVVQDNLTPSTGLFAATLQHRKAPYRLIK